ncbi:helix-turn-helix transcriptional regulator [Actinocorallia longicatena]|uniref:Helix-turn-helix transcriptional regulator n=1 Tax=Actinocorallia longicatena TaxID=111803 RepID=A0ABP6QI81_9ACTN
MAYDKRPLGRYLLIGHELNRLRDRRGLTLKAAARQSHHSPSWMSTVENGLAAIRSDDLKGLLLLYDCPDADLNESLIHLAERGRLPSWWRAFEGMANAAAVHYASLEADASRIFSFQLQLIPGLLQTPEYTRAVTSMNPDADSTLHEATAELRKQRQQVLHGPDPTIFQAVISESVFHLLVGGSQVMREQAAHLHELAQRPNIELRIIPHGGGVHPGVDGAFTILTFKPRGRLNVAVPASAAESRFLVQEADRRLYADIARQVIDAALPPEPSLELLARIASAL